MNDKLMELGFYKLSRELWDSCWADTEVLKKDFRGMEIAKQLIRSVGSISANIEKGYGRGFGKEYPRFLRISRGTARESQGWYSRSRFLLKPETIELRCQICSSIIAMITKSIVTLEAKNNKK